MFNLTLDEVGDLVLAPHKGRVYVIGDSHKPRPDAARVFVSPAVELVIFASLRQDIKDGYQKIKNQAHHA